MHQDLPVRAGCSDSVANPSAAFEQGREQPRDRLANLSAAHGRESRLPRRAAVGTMIRCKWRDPASSTARTIEISRNCGCRSWNAQDRDLLIASIALVGSMRDIQHTRAVRLQFVEYERAADADSTNRCAPAPAGGHRRRAVPR